jgi:lipid-A-disaccharide synthase
VEQPGVEVFGFGGAALAAAGAGVVADYRRHSVTGLVEVLKLLPRTYALYRRLVDEARARRPDVFVAIDFPDFNFRLAAAMRPLGIPVVYYVSPQLWAWRPGRLRTMQRIANRVLVIFPFEVPIYAKAGIPVEFVGHPLVDLISRGEPRASFLPGVGLRADAPTVALLPGSRPNELKQILPTLVDAAGRIAGEVRDAQFVVARAPNLDDELFSPMAALTAARTPVAIVDGRTDDVLSAADVVITASGTATVQAALHRTPMVIVYKLAPLTYRLGIRFVKVTTYGMVNLVAGRRIVPELIQDDFTSASVTREAVALLTDRGRADRMRSDLEDVVARLGGSGASTRAAKAIIALAGERQQRNAVTE